MIEYLIYFPILIPLLTAIAIKSLWPIETTRKLILYIGPILTLACSIYIYDKFDQLNSNVDIINIFDNITISLGIEPISMVFSHHGQYSMACCYRILTWLHDFK